MLSRSPTLTFTATPPAPFHPLGARLRAGASVAALLMASTLAWGQASGSGTGGSGGTGYGGDGSGSAPADRSAPAARQGSAETGSAVVRQDRAMMTNLAQANLAEIQSGQLALEKSQNPRVREFAQRMMDEHRRSLNDMQQLARSRNVTLPEDTDLAHKTVNAALRLLSGDTFDRQYLNRVGINDHQRTLELLQEAQKNARDPELKTFAARQVPIVQAHLTMAQQLSDATTSSATGSSTSPSTSGPNR